MKRAVQMSQRRNKMGAMVLTNNVLTEIGGAFLAYQRKIILLVDRRVKLPSNLQGLYRCEYEGEELAFSMYQKLEKALVAFRRP
jgi:predicted nucleotide-binding protein